MAKTRIDYGATSFDVVPQGWYRLWSLRLRVRVPYGCVTAVEHDLRHAENGPVGLRVPGTNVPGVILAGTYWKFWGASHVRSFWIRRHTQNCITIRLREHEYDYLTIEVDDPAAAIARLQDALRSRGFA
jgi:hypothetical protein